MLFVPSDSCSASVITCQHGMHAQLQALINVQMYFSVQHSTRYIQNHIEHGLMIYLVLRAFNTCYFPTLDIFWKLWNSSYQLHQHDSISLHAHFLFWKHYGNILEIVPQHWPRLSLAYVHDIWKMFGTVFPLPISVSEFCVFIMLCSRQC